MSDKYTEEAFKALKDSIDDAIRNTLDAYLDDDQMIHILEVLDKRGFKIVAKPPFPPIPFVIRPIKSMDELERYSVRREEVHGGVNYYAYYHQPDSGTAERVKAEFDKELGCTNKTKIVVVLRGSKAPSDATISEIPLPNMNDWIVNLPRFVDYVENPEELAARIRGSVADLDIAETYPKTVTLAVNLPKDSFKVIVHHDNTVDFIRSRGESFFPRAPYLETLQELQRLIVGTTDFELHKVQLTRGEFRKKVTEVITSALGANPQFKGVTFIPATRLNYDVVTRPFDIELSQAGETYNVEVKTPNTNYVTEDSIVFLMSAIKSVVEGVHSEGKDSVETRRLIITNLNYMFKDNGNFKGVVFIDQLEA